MGGRQSRSSRRVQPSLPNSMPYVWIPSSTPPQRHARGPAGPAANKATMVDQKTTKTPTKANTFNKIKDVKGKSKIEENDVEADKETTFEMVYHPKAKMQIIIDTLPTRNSIGLEVSEWDTIETIKAKIHNKEGIPAGQQTLIYAGQVLADQSTLGKYNVRRHPTLHMVLHPIPKTKICVETPENGTITLEVDVWNTIQNIKSMIAAMVGVGTDRQIIFCDRKQLDDYYILADCNIETALRVVYSPMQIFIKMWSGKTITVEADCSDTVDELMNKIWIKEQTPIKHQSLNFEGKRLDPGRTLADYNVRKESTLHLVMAASWMIEKRIFIRLISGETIAVALEGYETIYDVKEKIHELSGIPVRSQTLTCSGQEMRDYQTINDYSLKNGSLLSLMY